MGVTRSTKQVQTQTLFASLVRIVLIFFILTLWALFIGIGYGYRRVQETGLIDWIRLPSGVAPFAHLSLEMADVIAFGALFVAILLASTVQMSATVSAADDIADQRPTTEAEAQQQQEELGIYANQAEMAMIVSFGAAFFILLLTVLFGLQEMAMGLDAPEGVDAHGVGWVNFAANANALLHPRVVLMYVVSFLSFLMTYASMPSWKNTGLFRRQVEENAWEARERLRVIAKEHDLSNICPIQHPGGVGLVAIAGYAVYAILFVLALNFSLSLLAGGAGFQSLLTLDRWPMLGALATLAVMITTAVGSVMLRIHHLQGKSNALIVISLVLAIAAVMYIVFAEGATWTLALFIVVVPYSLYWWFLYGRAVTILDRKDPHVWEFFLNPPKLIVMRRYEVIRASADRVTQSDDEILAAKYADS